MIYRDEFGEYVLEIFYRIFETDLETLVNNIDDKMDRIKQRILDEVTRYKETHSNE